MLYERTAISCKPEELARQKRMTIGDRDFYLDLLFYQPQPAPPGGH